MLSKTITPFHDDALPYTKQSRFAKLIQGPRAFLVTVIVAFCESSFFPLPPDIGIISIVLYDRSKAWKIAFWCSVASVLGGLLGYVIGAYLFEGIGHFIIDTYGLEDRFISLKEKFQHYGFWILIFKGFTPIPYKLLTIASGVFHLNVWQFVVASTIARSARFFILSAGLWYFGPLAKPYFERFFGWIIFATMALVVMGFALISFL